MNWNILLTSSDPFHGFSCQVVGDEKRFSSPGISIEVESDLEGARVYFDTLYMGHVLNGSLTIPVDTMVNHPGRMSDGIQRYLPHAGHFPPEAGKTIATGSTLAIPRMNGTGWSCLQANLMEQDFF